MAKAIGLEILKCVSAKEKQEKEAIKKEESQMKESKVKEENGLS